LIIDWNAARVGPAMFDVAMTAPYDGPARRAHDAGWQEVTGELPDPEADRAAHAWAETLINSAFAGVVAHRAGPDEAARMIVRAEAAYERFGEESRTARQERRRG
jgi:hypothetical protein